MYKFGHYSFVRAGAAGSAVIAQPTKTIVSHENIELATWNNRPSTEQNSIEALGPLTQLYLCKKKSSRLLEGQCCIFKPPDEYSVKNTDGVNLFRCLEDSTNVCKRLLWNASRDYRVQVMDTSGRPLLHVARAATFICRKAVMRVDRPNGTNIGTIEEDYSGCRHTLQLLDSTEFVLFRIHLPRFIDSQHEYKISSITGEQEGSIIQVYSGLEQDLLNCEGTLAISFPQNADVDMKAIILGAAFLIDFMYYK